MARKKQQEAPAPTPVTTMNAAPAAPAYGSYAAPPAAPNLPPPSASAAYGVPPASNGAQSVAFGPPPPRAPQEPFINAAFLWAYQRPIKAKIDGMRDATGTGNADFQKQRPGQAPKRAWFLDFTLEDGNKATGRINEGDMRHHKLWAAYQTNLVGRTIVLRLSNPGDIDPFTGKPTKSPWMIDPQ